MARSSAGKGGNRTAKQASTTNFSTASRLNAGGLRSAIREAFGSFWTVSGHPGLYGYVQGCKPGYKPKSGEVIARADYGPGKQAAGIALAVFKRDTEAENLVLKAVGK